jgi:glycosyltransferase involved in cell wall biosynthesis
VVKELVPAVRLYEIPNAVPAGRQQDKQRVVAFGGAISLRKGVDVLVDAWSQIEHRDWKLILAGPIMDERLVRKMDSCTFVGPLPHDELMHLLETASIAVLPSRDEGMPMFLVEAMARGCSVLSTRVGGVPRLVGDGGLLVSAGSTSELKSALQLLMADNDLRASYSVAAHARYRSAYSADVIYPQVESLWQSLVVKAR